MKIKVRIDIAPLPLSLVSRFHLEANSFWFEVSKSELTASSLENLDW